MTDDQIRSRLREALTEDALERMRVHAAIAADEAYSREFDREERDQAELSSWREGLSATLTPLVRDLLSAETQQIREERDALRLEQKSLLDNFLKAALKAEQAEAETQALREALDIALARAECIHKAARDISIDADAIQCVESDLKHDKARLTPASPRTGEEERGR